MSNQLSPTPKLNVSAKEFVPKSKLASPPANSDLNPTAKEYKPKLTESPAFAPIPFVCVSVVPPPFFPIPPPLEPETEVELFENEDETPETPPKGSKGEEAKEEFVPKVPKRIYQRTYLLTFKEKCQRRPKDMRPIEIPLKSKANIQFSPYEQVQRTEAAESVRNLRILLNKLAGENFARVSDTILNNFAYTEGILQELAKILFNKCVKEPKYIHLYIELVDQLFRKFSLTKLKEPGKENLGLNFRRMFLDLCQEAFENRENENFLKELPSDLTEEEKAFKKKQRIFGNMKLIGELFSHGAINDTIVVQCMEKMKKEGSEGSIENICHLLMTVGKKLYEYFAFEARLTTLTKKPRLRIKVINKELFDDYIDYLVAIKQTDKITSRVKFLIQDLIDIRDNDWSNAFNQFPVTKPLGGKEEIIAFRKKTKSIEASGSPARSSISESKALEKPSAEEAAEIPDAKLETREFRKRSLNERNVFGKNLEKYQKTHFEEKLRLKWNNLVEEYLLARKLEDIKENLTEMCEIEQVQRCICVGLCILYSFTKNPADFRKVYQMILDLAQDSAVRIIDVEEGTVVALANFYDMLIDNPNAPTMMKEMLTAFENGKLVTKEFVEKCMQHVDTLKRQLEEEYAT